MKTPMTTLKELKASAPEMLLKFFTSPGFMEERGGKDISTKVHLKACGSLQSQLEEESVV